VSSLRSPVAAVGGLIGNQIGKDKK